MDFEEILKLRESDVEELFEDNLEKIAVKAVCYTRVGDRYCSRCLNFSSRGSSTCWLVMREPMYEWGYSTLDDWCKGACGSYGCGAYMDHNYFSSPNYRFDCYVDPAYH